MEPKEMEDIQSLINIFFPFAEEMIVQYGDFYPYAGATTLENEFVSVGFHEENKQLSPARVVENLKNDVRLAGPKYLVTAIFYDVKARNADSGESQDAIAVFVEHRDGKEAYEFFYPYKIGADDSFIVNDSYGNAVPREIF